MPSYLLAYQIAAPPSTVVMIVFYNLIQCSTNCWFARRCYIATGRSLRVFALLFVLVGALLVVSSAAIVLNIWVFARGSSYIVVSLHRQHAKRKLSHQI